ncbi:hypothetical protein SRABI106_03341 [Rahnella aquatilis]|nr:hypothetical protein SRABI106_03341 [Rahnella aquatilis]
MHILTRTLAEFLQLTFGILLFTQAAFKFGQAHAQRFDTFGLMLL